MLPFHTAVVLLLVCCSFSSATKIVQPSEKNAYVAEGSTLQIVCLSNVTVVWKAGGVVVPIAGRILTSEANNTAGYESLRTTLTIKSVITSDTGTYECRDYDDILNQDSSGINVKIVKALKLQILRNGTGPLHPGDDLNLECTGEYRSTPRWMHDNKEVKDGLQTAVTDRTHMIKQLKMSYLTTWNVTWRAAGRYQCIDSAHHQSDSDVIVVYVSQTNHPAASGLLVAICCALLAATNHLFS